MNVDQCLDPMPVAKIYKMVFPVRSISVLFTPEVFCSAPLTSTEQILEFAVQTNFFLIAHGLTEYFVNTVIFDDFLIQNSEKRKKLQKTLILISFLLFLQTL